MAKFVTKDLKIVTPNGIIKGIDLGLTLPDAIKDELKKFNGVESFEVPEYKPIFDPGDWAESQGLEVTNEGIFCYKAVYQLTAGDTTRYFAPRNLLSAKRASADYVLPRGTNLRNQFFREAINGTELFFEVCDPFEYTLNEEVKCGYFETDPERECAPGLYGSTIEFAEKFMYPWIDKVAILKLFVPFENNQILVPYCGYSIFKMPSDKFRFKRCIPVSAVYKVPTQRPSESELFDHWDYRMNYAIMKVLDDPRLVLQVFSVADRNKFVNSAVDAMLEDMTKQEE